MFYVHIFYAIELFIGLVRQSSAVERQRLRRPGRHRDETGEDMASRACTDERVLTVTVIGMSSQISFSGHISELVNSFLTAHQHVKSHFVPYISRVYK